MEDYIKELNQQQQDAVLYLDGPQLVIAGAGSGKTRVLTYKIVHLLNNNRLLNIFIFSMDIISTIINKDNINYCN